MISIWITLFILLVITFGFAGLLGTQIYHLRSQANSRQVAAALAVSGLVMLPPLSLPPVHQWIGWLAATLVVVLFALRPHNLPSQLWTLRFGLRYASLVMVLIAFWGISAGMTLPAYFLSGFACLAAALSWFRSQASQT